MPGVDLVSVQELDIRSLDDPDILERAALEKRVLLTHDVNTVPRFAVDRLKAGKPMPGVVVVPDQMAIGQAIEELVILVELGNDQTSTSRSCISRSDP